MNQKLERRALTREVDASDKGFGGLGAVYYDGTSATEWRAGDAFVERFMPGAFREWYTSGAEAFSFFDHDRSVILGRRSSGLQLVENELGLSYFVTFDPNDPDHARVRSKIARGDVRGSSIIFSAQDEEYRKEGGIYIREISRAIVLEIGPTAFPVYEHTTAEARSRSLEELIAAAKAACVDVPDSTEFDLLMMS